MYLLGFPLLLIPFAIYNIVAFLMPGVELDRAVHARAHGLRRATGPCRPGDVLITLAILLLFGEMLKSTRIGMRTVVDHGLSLCCSSPCWSSSCWSSRPRPRPSSCC